MFRTMRRHKQQLSEEESIAVLERGKTGVLAVIGDEGYPYTVPINYVYYDGKIYLHSAKTGHKIDAIRANDKVSFCVIDADDVVPEEYSTNFRSVMAFGRARILEDEDQKLAPLRRLGDKYNPGQDAALDAEVARSMRFLHMIEIEIEHLSGKQSKELAKVTGPLDEAAPKEG
ncbi:MAG TPA: 5-nitroimidazole antibiotic resistance protein [Eggerthellaceae bacterium]|nr:5-nitroimidazole antibiotic resistance protein [Eggerthellaceae bacterium]